MAKVITTISNLSLHFRLVTFKSTMLHVVFNWHSHDYMTQTNYNVLL